MPIVSRLKKGYIDNPNQRSPFRGVTEADKEGDEVKENEGERGGT